MKQGKLETRPLGQRVAEAESTRRSEFEDMSDAELVALTSSDVLVRDNGQVQLSVVGKGGVVRQVLLPEIVSRPIAHRRH